MIYPQIGLLLVRGLTWQEGHNTRHTVDLNQRKESIRLHSCKYLCYLWSHNCDLPIYQLHSKPTAPL